MQLQGMDAASTQSAPPFWGLKKRRMSDSAVGGQQAGEKRCRPQFAHVEAAIQQVRHFEMLLYLI